MDRKVLFLDLDGTLTNDDKKVTPKTLKALKQIMEDHIGHGFKRVTIIRIERS